MTRNKSKNNICIDREKIAGDLKVQEHGRDAGLENQPPSTATEPCDRENPIQRYHDNLAQENKNVHEEELQVVDQKWREMNKNLEELAIRECRDQAQQNVLEAKTAHSSEHKKAALHRNHCKRRLAMIRDKGIDASSSALGSYGLVYAVLVLFLLVESFANSYFLGMGSEIGMLGGGIEAFFIASLSIALSFSAGMGVRVISGRSLARRIAAVIGGCIYIGTAVVYHTIIGWYRGCLVYLEPETAKADTIGNFIQHGLALPDLHCYGLAVVGISFGLTAFIAGLHSRDARLAAEHGRVAKEYEVADTRLQDMEKAYFASINEACVSQLEEVDARLKDAYDAGSQQRFNALECGRIKNNFEKHTKDILNSYAYAIELFRRSCKAVRDTPLPAYFNDKPSSLTEDTLILDSQIEEEIEQAVKSLNEHLRKLAVIANEEKGRIRGDYKKHLQEAPAFIEKLRTATEDDFVQQYEVSSREDKTGEELSPSMTIIKPAQC